ncbi:MAG: hypothetical protein P4L77_11420 [Sulfuriferula sp.]|nr:hypothetical protein [Sulfuriferula sp.]
MSTPIDGTTYPFDPTGKLASNLITGEMQTLVPGTQGSFHFIVPKLAPYFVDSMKATFEDTAGNIRPLTMGVDFVCTHVFHDASLACASPIAGSLSFYNLQLSGQIQLQYQTLGGIWTLDIDAIQTILADRLHNPRITTWEQVTEQPVTFPVIDHEWNLVDLVGMSDVLAELQNIEAVLRQTGSSGLAQHIADHNNPHFVTATQVGLGNVQNYGVAANADAIAGVSTTLYMTPAATAAAISSLPSQALAQHEADHGNPHVVTATQVGLGLVQNYGVASTADAQAGTRDDVYMTPLKVATQLNNGFGQALANHEDNFQNPHQVNAHQTGAYTQGEVDALLNGYIPAGGTVANAQMLNGQTPAQLTASILQGNAATATNASEFGGQNPADFTASVLAGNAATASNALAVFGYNLAQLTAAILQGTAANAQQFGNQTPAQFTASVLEGTAANADAIGGQTPTQFAASISTQVLTQLEATIGTVCTQSLQGQLAGAGPFWIELGYVPFPVSGQPSLPDMQMFVSGGDSYDSTAGSGLYLVTLSSRTPTPTLKVINLNGVNTGAEFGWTQGPNPNVAGETVLFLWIKTPGDVNFMTSTELSQQSFTFTSNSTPVTVAPAGITYQAEDGFALISDVVSLMTTLQESITNATSGLPSA